jgi:crotonobetainyl-CoA:carnitine CoA-transferase CaiB-like acyl-CoA transferase
LAPPVLGQHTNEVLAEILNLGAHEIADLQSRGIV